MQVAIGQYLGSGGMTLVAQLCPMLKGENIHCRKKKLWKLNVQAWELRQWQWWVFWTSTTAWSSPGLSFTSLQPILLCQAYLGPLVVTSTSFFCLAFPFVFLNYSCLIQCVWQCCQTVFDWPCSYLDGWWNTKACFKGSENITENKLMKANFTAMLGHNKTTAPVEEFWE